MSLNRSFADADDKEHYVRMIQWAQKHGVCFNDLPCTDDLVNCDGIHLEVIVDAERDDEHIKIAIAEGRAARDVVSTSVTVVPNEWLREAVGQDFDRDEFHDYVVAHGFGAPLPDAYNFAEKEFYRGIPYGTLAHEVIARSWVTDLDEESVIK